jgi:pyruvate ferredoxin oxidoreductase gamma subunit
MAEKNMIEIRWHGRGGQGAKTAALLFAESAMATGKYIQAFPEYGPERMGAPVQSFDRISDTPITLHCAVTEPETELTDRGPCSRLHSTPPLTVFT